MKALSEYSDREIEMMMRESIKRMKGTNALDQRNMRDLYDEYRSRPKDRRDDSDGMWRELMRETA